MLAFSKFTFLQPSSTEPLGIARYPIPFGESTRDLGYGVGGICHLDNYFVVTVRDTSKKAPRRFKLDPDRPSLDCERPKNFGIRPH